MSARDAISVLACVTLIVTSVSFTSSQEKKDPPAHQVVLPADSSPGAAGTKLPKIELPEFVITGKEPVDLPEGSKTAADEQRVSTPSTGVTTPGVREFGPAILAGEQKSQAGFPGLTNGYNGKAQAGYGTHATPYFDAWFGNSYPSADFLLRAGYRSSGGHVANADYRVGYASLTGGTHLSNDAGDFSDNRIQGRIAMSGNSYRLYGSANPTLQRTVADFDAGISMTSSNAAILPYAASIRIESGSLNDVSRTSETSLGLSLDGSGETGDIELKGTADIWKSFYSAQSVMLDPFYTQLTGIANYRLANSVGVRGGLAFYLFRGSDTKTAGRLYPQLGISWYAAENLTVYAKYEPAVQRASISSLTAANPYIATDAALHHAAQFTNFSFGAETEAGRGIQSRASLNYTRTDDVPIFVDPNSTGVWSVIYLGTTRILSLNVEVYADLSSADHLGASFAIRSNKNSETGRRNPYFASLVSSASYQHRFDYGLTLGSTLQIVGRQSVDLTDSRALPAFAVFNVDAEYVIIPRCSIVCAIHDIFNQEQTMWDGYVGLRRTVSMGTSFAW